MILRYEPRFQQIALQLGRAMHQESRYKNYDYSDKKILQLLQNPNVFCACSMVNDTVVGFFIGIVQPLWFSEQKIGFDLALYILPEHRGGTYAIRLIKAFEAFCIEQGCVEINLSSSADISTELAQRLYAKLNYQPCGFISRKETSNVRTVCHEYGC